MILSNYAINQGFSQDLASRPPFDIAMEARPTTTLTNLKIEKTLCKDEVILKNNINNCDICLNIKRLFLYNKYNNISAFTKDRISVLRDKGVKKDILHKNVC